MTTHVIFDTNSLVDFLTDTYDVRGSKELGTLTCRALKQAPDAKDIKVHTTLWILGEARATLVNKLGYSDDEANRQLREFALHIARSGGVIDTVNAYANPAERSRLAGKAISNDFYDAYGNPEMGDEGVLESVERVEATLGTKVVIVTNDVNFTAALNKRGRTVHTPASYVAGGYR